MALNDLGAVPANSVLPIFWTSHDAATGANETMSGLATSDIEVYKGTSITQRSSDAGYALIDTDGLDIDSLTGVNGISIDLSDNTDAGFYAAGSFYNVIVGPVTIDAQTMYVHVATFRIVAAEHTAGYVVATIKDGTGTGEIDTTSGGVLVSAIAANAITATAINADAITDAKVASDVTIASVTGAVGSVTGAVGSVTGNVGGNVTGSVGSVAAGGITAGSFAADAITAAKIAADVTTELQSGLATAADLATVAGYLDTEVAAILADTNELQTDWVNGGRLDLLIDAIKAKTDNLPADPADDSDIDTQLATIAGYLDTEMAATLAAVDTEVAAIKAKTDNLPASPAAVGSAMTLDLTQALDLTPVTDSVGDALVAAVSQGFGKWTLAGTTLTLYAHDGTTVVRTFTLDDATDPTSRT